MPDTRIDLSDNIPSIRLKVPTGTVPVPPVGFGQLHSPSPGVLALRLSDGSVVEVGPAASGSGSGIRTDRSGITIPAGGGWTVVPFSAGTEDFNTAGFALVDNGAGVDIYQFPTAGIYDVAILVHVSAQANAGGSTISLRTPNGVVDYRVPAAAVPFTILWADLVNVPSDDFDLALRLANDGAADVETDEIVLAARRV